MSIPVSSSTEAALFAAMERLLANKCLNTDGRLTVANLAREALISRATANRAIAVLDAYRAAIAARKSKAPRPAVGSAERAAQHQAAHVSAQYVQARAMLQRSKRESGFLPGVTGKRMIAAQSSLVTTTRDHSSTDSETRVSPQRS